MIVLVASWWLRQQLPEDPGQTVSEGGVRLVSVCETAVATTLLISAIWSAVKVVAELEEDVPAIWSRRVFLLACRVNG